MEGKKTSSTGPLVAMIEEQFSKTFNKVTAEKQKFEQGQQKEKSKVIALTDDVAATLQHIQQKADSTQSEILKMKDEQKQLAQKIAEAEISGDSATLARLEKELNNLINKIQSHQLKYTAFQKMKPTITPEKREELLTRIKSLSALSLDLSPFEQLLEEVKETTELLKTYEQKIQKELATGTTSMSVEQIIVSTNLEKIIVTEEAQRHIQAGKEQKLHNHSIRAFIQMWLAEPKDMSFTEFCEEQYLSLLAQQNIAYQVVNERKAKAKKEIQERNEQVMRNTGY